MCDRKYVKVFVTYIVAYLVKEDWVKHGALVHDQHVGGFPSFQTKGKGATSSTLH
jgi:hypothetical protein